MVHKTGQPTGEIGNTQDGKVVTRKTLHLLRSGRISHLISPT